MENSLANKEKYLIILKAINDLSKVAPTTRIIEALQNGLKGNYFSFSGSENINSLRKNVEPSVLGDFLQRMSPKETEVDVMIIEFVRNNFHKKIVSELEQACIETLKMNGEKGLFDALNNFFVYANSSGFVGNEASGEYPYQEVISLTIYPWEIIDVIRESMTNQGYDLNNINTHDIVDEYVKAISFLNKNPISK